METTLAIAVVIATLVGPVLAVIVTRITDERRQLRARQLDIFRSLMGSRRATLSPERVKALNMVEIDFYGNTAIEKIHAQVMANINITTRPLPDDWHITQQKLVTKLLTEMAKALNYNLQQLDIFDGGYYPQGIVDIETEQQALRQVLIEVLSGRRPLIVSSAAPTPPLPFPAPPPPPAAKQNT